MIWLLACTTSDAELPSPAVPNPPIVAEETPTKIQVDWTSYPFLNSSERVKSLHEMFATPAGYTRVALDEGSFGDAVANLLQSSLE